MIRFSHSNKDTKDEEKGRELVDKHDPANPQYSELLNGVCSLTRAGITLGLE